MFSARSPTLQHPGLSIDTPQDNRRFRVWVGDTVYWTYSKQGTYWDTDGNPGHCSFSEGLLVCDARLVRAVQSSCFTYTVLLEVLVLSKGQLISLLPEEVVPHNPSILLVQLLAKKYLLSLWHIRMIVHIFICKSQTDITSHLLTFLTVGKTHGLPWSSRYAPMATLTLLGRGSFLWASTRPNMASGGPCSTPDHHELGTCEKDPGSVCV